MHKLILYILTIAVLLTASCRKRYYDCNCAELTIYYTVDSFKTPVRARNYEQAKRKCRDRELKLSNTNGLGTLYCTVPN